MRRDAAVAAHLGDEAAAGLERAPHAGDHGVGAAHPVQGGVREDGVELAREGQLLAARDAAIEAARARARDLLGARVDADDLAAEGDELLGERAVAAAEVEDALAGARRQQLDDRHAEVAHEAGVLLVALGTPALCGFIRPPASSAASRSSVATRTADAATIRPCVCWLAPARRPAPPAATP